MGEVRGSWCESFQQWGADVSVLVETKHDGQIDNVIQSIWHSRWMGKIQKEARGTVGESYSLG